MRSQPGTANTVFLVLCGGAGRRMGGVDKPLRPWRGKPMVDHILASVPAGMTKLISANRNLDDYAIRAPVVHDRPVLQRLGSASGPLVGVLAGLEALQADNNHEWLLVSPGDTPSLPEGWWQLMLQTAAATLSAAVVANDGERQQHLHMLLHQSLAEPLTDYLKAGKFAAFEWLADAGAAPALFNNPDAFKNFNRPEDLEERRP